VGWDWINPYHLQVASFALINAGLGLGIYVTLSAGQLSLANAGFMSVGAYTSALLSAGRGVPVPAAVACGTAAAAVLGALVGFPALRLRGVYLAIATLGFGEVIRVLLVNWESLTGGAVGIAAIPQMGRIMLRRAEAAGLSPARAGMPDSVFIALSVFFVLAAAASATALFFLRQERSRIGRAFRAIRADETAASAMGIDVTRYKMLAFVEGAAVSGLCGALYAHATSYISPADFTYHRAVEILVYAVFGGTEHLLGPILGASILTLLPEVLRPLAHLRYMVYGLALVVMTVFRPEGLAGRRRPRAAAPGPGLEEG